MRRRNFLGSLAAGAGALSISKDSWAFGERHDGTVYGAHPSGQTRITRLAGMSLEEMRDFHIREIEKEYLPMWDNRRVDSRYGGVRPFVNPDGTYMRSNKEMYYLGRAIWVFSYLYNHFGKRKEHLDIAEHTIDFIYKYGRDKKGYWNSEFTREGKVTHGSFNIYGDMYVVLALGEYYKATGNEKARDIAIETAHLITERITSPDYGHLGGHGPGNEPGTKRLGTWQHFLSALTPLARYTDDYGVSMMARMCVHNIMNRHWHPELGVCFERLDDQFRPFPVDTIRNNRIISGWHAIQAAWMVMDDSLRTGDVNTFNRALDMGRITLESCWVHEDERGESGLANLTHPGAKPEFFVTQQAPIGLADYVGSPWNSLDDVFVYSLLAVEHTHAQWAVDWFDRVYRTSYAHPERQLRVCLLHHPRRLFFVPQAINRIIERGGRVSEFLKVT